MNAGAPQGERCMWVSLIGMQMLVNLRIIRELHGNSILWLDVNNKHLHVLELVMFCLFSQNFWELSKTFFQEVLRRLVFCDARHGTKMSDVIVAKRIAVKWDPPTLLLEYTK